MSENMFAKGLFIKLEGAEPSAKPGGAYIQIGGSYYDVSPYLSAFESIGANVAAIARSPYDPRPFMNLRHTANALIPALNSARHAHPAVQQTLVPLVRGLASAMAQSKNLVGMRLKTAHHLAQAPKILIPICLAIPAGGTLAGVRVSNPYLGSTEGNTGPYQFPWTIVCFRTGNGEDGGLRPIKITQYQLGGHDFVGASLAGLTYTAGGAPAVLGWPAAAFAETARKNFRTEVQPWNVVAQSGAGVGFGSIMTETGYLQCSVHNAGATTYVDGWSVYANATLCGSPFGGRYTQVDLMRRAFVPLALQGPIAMKIARDAGVHIGQIVPRDDQDRMPDAGPYGWSERTEGAMNQIESFLANPPAGLAMGEHLGDPGEYGFNLVEGARLG